MKKEYLEEIERAVQKAAIDNTLSKETVKYVGELIEENESLRKEDSSKVNEIKLKDEKIDKNNTQLNCLRTEVTMWESREKNLLERETKMTEIEVSLQYEKMRVTDHKDMFEKVFRNIETRRNVFTPVPGMKTDQYGMSVQPHVEINDETTKKE